MARFRPRGLGLERVLGVGALFSAAYGNVGSSIYYALGLVAAFALGLTPIVYLIAGVLFVMTAMTYAEAATNFPEAGGSSSFARRAFNEAVSFLAAWGQMLNDIITVAISAFFVPHYLGVFWEPLRESPGDIIGGIVIVALLSLINIVGVRESARLNLVLAVIAVMVIYSGLPSVALSALPVTHDASGYHTQLADQYAGDPILGIVKNMNLGAFQTTAEYYVGVLAATILLIASNAGIIGVSRLTYS